MAITLIGLIIAIAEFETLSVRLCFGPSFTATVGSTAAGIIGVLGVLVYIIPLLLKETIVLTGTFGHSRIRIPIE